MQQVAPLVRARGKGVFFLPIILKARSDDHTSDLLKKFKKIIAATDIIQMVKDRKYYQKPSEIRTVRMNEIRRSQKRKRAIKKLKNAPIPRPPRKLPRRAGME